MATERSLKPMLSIITPVFEGRGFIEDCIRAVTEQDCPSVEHIIVDGASADGTIEVVEEFARKYPHIRWVSEKDRGQSDAMNKGLAMARGSIVSFLNADDFYEPDVFRRILEIFENLKEPSFISGNCNILGEDGRIIAVNRPRNLGYIDLLMGWKINPIPANPSAYFYHKSLHERVGLYDADSHFAMDLDFVLRAVRGARQVKYYDETWGNFRYIPGTKTYRDCQKPSDENRYSKVIHSYRSRLSLLDRTRLEVKFGCYKANSWLRRHAKSMLCALGLRAA